MPYEGPKRNVTLAEEFEHYLKGVYGAHAVGLTPEARREFRRAFMAGVLAVTLSKRYHGEEIHRYLALAREGKD